MGGRTWDMVNNGVNSNSPHAIGPIGSSFSKPSPTLVIFCSVILFSLVLLILAILTGVRSMCVKSELCEMSSKNLLSIQCTLLHTEKCVGRLSRMKCSYHTSTQKWGQEEAFADEARFITLWRWSHECMLTFKFLKLYMLNMCHFLVCNHTSVKTFF